MQNFYKMVLIFHEELAKFIKIKFEHIARIVFLDSFLIVARLPT